MKIGIGLCLSFVIFASLGCKSLLERDQSPDKVSTLPLRDKKEKGPRYIGDICGIWGLSYSKVEGVGLAVGLNGTGSAPSPSGQLDYLIKELETHADSQDVKKMIASSNTELVLLKGLLPPGIRKGDRFDIELQPLGNSDATSLKNGHVLPTDLRPMELLGRQVRQGKISAKARGSILIDSIFQNREDQASNLHGYILGGGIALEDRPLGLAIKKKEADVRTATLIARAVNARYTIADSTGRKGVADPKSDRNIELLIPDAYRNNVGRFLQVVSNIKFGESKNLRLERMKRLEKELRVPDQAALASLRLEGLGKLGIPILQKALEDPHPEVKFYAAQALAYLGQNDGVEQLRYVAETEPAFRWHALRALAALDDPTATTALADLMHVTSAETRYGAFSALRDQDEKNPLVAGRWLNDFFLHRIASKTSPMIHFSRKKRPEIVLFGDDQTVTDDFLYVEDGLTVKAQSNGSIVITRYRLGEDDQRIQCSNRVGDLIEGLSRAGCSYGDLIVIFKSAKKAGTLPSRLAINVLPKLGRTYVPGTEPVATSDDHSQNKKID